MEENFQAYLGKGSVPVRNMQRVMGTKIVPLEQLLRQDAGNVQIEEMQNVPFRVRKILYHIDRQEYQVSLFLPVIYSGNHIPHCVFPTKKSVSIPFRGGGQPF